MPRNGAVAFSVTGRFGAATLSDPSGDPARISIEDGSV
jgi:hypothetical protein